MKRFMQTVGLVLGLAVVMAPAAQAAGTEWISGWAEGRITYYDNPRTVTNPASPGPEVAFLQSTGPSDLHLGPNNCNRQNTQIMRPQVIGVWSPVAYYSSETTFCLSTSSPSSQNWFNGTLDWD